jgi:DedD protein
MGLLSLFQRKARQQTGGAAARSNADPAAAAEAVRQARARARRRLMGATVLLLAGVIGFPLLFETRPRPIPVDLPIEIPARTSAAALGDAGNAPRANRLTSPAAPTETAASVAMAVPAPAPAPIVTETAPPPAPANVPAPASITQSAPHPVQFAASAATAKPAASKPVATPAPTPAAPSARASAPATAAAAAEKASDAAADSGHYVVQIGAFAEQPKAHEARMKVEKLGLKTYVQVVDTPQGKRIRVRVGPYATKAEADKAAARIKGDGLPAAVLLL